MKADIHPKTQKVTYKCNCGATFEYNSTIEDFTADVCGKCHPFYTGKQKLVDTAGRVDKFRARAEAAKKRQEEMAAAASTKTGNETVEEKMTRKAMEKEEEKAEKKAKEEAKKEEKMKKEAEETVVKQEEEVVESQEDDTAEVEATEEAA